MTETEHRLMCDLTARENLTTRELECARLFAAGKSYNQVAKKLGIRGTTVHYHAFNLRRKLNAANLVQAIAILCQEGGLNS